MNFNPDREAQWILCRAAKLAGGLPFTREHLAEAMAEQRVSGAVYITGHPRGRGSLPPSVADEYRAGKTVEMLASLHGVSMPTMYQHLVSLGVDMRHRGPRKGIQHPDGRKTRKLPTSKISEVLSEYTAGRTLRDIGAQFGISYERVRQIAQLNGCKARRAA
jgi:hypothetical protein